MKTDNRTLTVNNWMDVSKLPWMTPRRARVMFTLASNVTHKGYVRCDLEFFEQKIKPVTGGGYTFFLFTVRMAAFNGIIRMLSEDLVRFDESMVKFSEVSDKAMEA